MSIVFHKIHLPTSTQSLPVIKAHVHAGCGQLWMKDSGNGIDQLKFETKIVFY